MKKGLFIIFEGPDKSGKSTQAALLVQGLKKRGVDVLHSREPGGTPFSEDIRHILLNSRHALTPLSELFLYEAARAQHTQEIILPALKAGKTVVLERYVLASLAYQGYGRGIPLSFVRRLNAAACGGLKANLTILVDIPAGFFSGRMKKTPPDRLEREGLSFRKRVRAGYLTLAKKERGVFTVDGCQEREEVRAKIWARVQKLL